MASDEKRRRIRSANYTSDERCLLLNLVNSYKHVIENKKTDHCSIKEKETAWQEITLKFNSRVPNNVLRATDSLRKYYENIKKKVRKDAADDKMNQYATGGGESSTITDPNFNLAVSIINAKTVHGIENVVDSDGAVWNNINEIEDKDIILQFENEPQDTNILLLIHITQKKKPKKSQLVLQISLWTRMSTIKRKKIGIYLHLTPISTPLKRMNNRENRRRPNAPTCTSASDISKQYSELANIKMEVANLQKKLLQEDAIQKQIDNDIKILKKENISLDIKLKEARLKQEEEEFELRKRSILLDIEKKKREM